jgi:hypothetical protein
MLPYLNFLTQNSPSKIHFCLKKIVQQHVKNTKSNDLRFLAVASKPFYLSLRPKQSTP